MGGPAKPRVGHLTFSLPGGSPALRDFSFARNEGMVSHGQVFPFAEARKQCDSIPRPRRPHRHTVKCHYHTRAYTYVEWPYALHE